MSSFLKDHQSSKKFNFQKLDNVNDITKYLDTLCETSKFKVFETPQSSKYMVGLMSYFKEFRSGSRQAIEAFMKNYFQSKNISFCICAFFRNVRNSIVRAVGQGYLIQNKQTFFRSKNKYKFKTNTHSASIEPVFLIYKNKERIVHIVERNLYYLFCLEIDEDSDFIYKTFEISKISALYTNVF